MDKDFHLFDWHRMFLGDTPAGFLLEIVFRTLIMYAYTIFLLRLLGKRGMGQLSTLELAIIICFGSAIGDPMMGVDVPILHGIVAVTTITLLQIGLERYINNHKKMEVMMEGEPDEVIKDGIIQVDKLKASNISHEDLYRSLRGKDVEQLGEVRKAFFETSGQLSVFFQSPKNVQPGLSILPKSESGEEHLFKTGYTMTTNLVLSCTNCGFTQSVTTSQKLHLCPVCACDSWEIAGFHQNSR